jgi:ParB family chromosome partitioning protein
MNPQDVKEIKGLQVSEIFADNNFNCRGFIAPIDVIELAKDIDAHGLQQPISVQLFSDDDPSKKYRIITGHRRHMAFKVLKREIIPCVINNNLSEAEALILNLGENLHRKDLNIMQEARALERLKMTGFTALEVSKHIGKSNTWVRIRYQLLELPDPIKEAAAAGYIKQTQIKEIHALGDYKAQIAAAIKIKSAKARGEKVPRIMGKKRDMFKKKPRDVDDIFHMQSHIQEHIGNNFGTRCLAWAAGEINDLELYRDIEEIAVKSDLPYHIPYEESKTKGLR